MIMSWPEAGYSHSISVQAGFLGSSTWRIVQQSRKEINTKYGCVSDNSDKKMHEIVLVKRFICYNADILRSYFYVSIAYFRKQKQTIMCTAQRWRAQYLQFFKITKIIFVRMMSIHWDSHSLCLCYIVSLCGFSRDLGRHNYGLWLHILYTIEVSSWDFLLHSEATKRTSVLSLAVPLYCRPDLMWIVGKFQLAVPRKYFTVLIKFVELISCKADSRSNSPETPHLLWNPEIYFHVHKSFKVVPVLTRIMQSTTCHCMSSISNFLSPPNISQSSKWWIPFRMSLYCEMWHRLLWRKCTDFPEESGPSTVRVDVPIW